MRTKLSGLALLALMLGTLLVACGDPTTTTAPAATTAAAKTTAAVSATTAASTTTAPAAMTTAAAFTGPKEKLSVIVGAQAAITYLQYDLAKALGYYDEQGLDVDIQYAKSGTDAASALIAGNAQFSGNAVDHAIAAKAKGKDLKMVASFTNLPGITMAVRSELKDQVKSVKDLKGKTIGVTGLGAGTDVLLTFILNKNGLTRDDVKIVAVGSGAQPAAFASGQIDAGLNSDPYVTQIVSSGKAFALVDMATLEGTKDIFGGEYQFTGALTTPEFIAQKPQVVQRLVNALVKANQYIAGHTAAEIAAKLPEEVTGKDLNTYIKGLEHSKPAISKDGLVTLDGIKNNLASQKVFGVVKEGQTYEPASFFDMSFVNKALSK